jgi:hypothetical protein
MINDSQLAPLRTREDFGKLLQDVEPKSAAAHNNLAWLLGDVVTSITFFDGGQTLVTGTQDSAVRLWDMTTGQELLTFHDHRSLVNSAAVKRDGSLLATNSVGGQVRLRHAPRRPEAIAARTELDPGDPLSPARQLDAADQFWAAGSDAGALAACGTAQLRLEKLIDRFPQARDYRRELARSWLVVSLVEGPPAGRSAPGEALARAVDLYRQLPDRSSMHTSVWDRTFKRAVNATGRGSCTGISSSC